MQRTLLLPLVLLVPAAAAPAAAQCAWQQSGQLVPQASYAASPQYFGKSLAVFGSTALVGAPGVDPSSPTPGSAFFFELVGTQWVQTAELADDDGQLGDDFGRSVALSFLSPDYVALVGAPLEAAGRGAAIAFEWTGTAWSEVAELVPSGAGENAGAGTAVALVGATALVGTPGEERVAVFEALAGGWTETGTLAPALEAGGFGEALAFDGTLAAVGAPGDDTVFVFERTAPGVWSQVAVLTHPDATGEGEFGESVALWGSRLVVGAPDDLVGAAYVYARTGGVWSLEQELVAVQPSIPVEFGRAVAIEGDDVVVGAPGEDDGLGAAYLFERDPSGAWVQTTELTPSLGSSEGQFGSYVGLAADRVMVNVGLDEAGLFGAAVNGAYAGAVFVWSSGGYVAPLAGFPTQVSLGTGGGQLLYLDAGTSLAAAPYLVLGSASGTAPGFAGLPLNLDAYLLFTVQFPNSLVQGSFGLLDGCGRGTATLLLPPETDAALAGATLHHAFVVLDPAGGPPTFVSNPTPVTLAP